MRGFQRRAEHGLLEEGELVDVGSSRPPLQGPPLDASFIPVRRTPEERRGATRVRDSSLERVGRKRLRRDCDALVVSPPYLILKGLPRVLNGDKWEVPEKSGNPALTHALAAFKGQLANTVKVVYSFNGAFGDGNAGVAIAKFKNYKEAEAASLAFEAAGRGKGDWRAVRTLPQPPTSVGKAQKELYGWLAEREDMESLPKKGKEFKWGMQPLKSVLEKHQERLKELEKLEARAEQAEKASKEVEKDLAELVKAQAAFHDRIADIDHQKSKAEIDFKKTQAARKDLQMAEKQKMNKAEADHKARTAELTRAVNTVREKNTKTEADLRKARECIFKKRIYEDQMQKRREEVKGLEKLLQEQRELFAEWEKKKSEQEESVRHQVEAMKIKQERLQKNHKELASLENLEKESKKQKDTRLAKARRMELLKNINESGMNDPCVVCFEDEMMYPPPPPNDPNIKELRKQCRHLLVPCGHRNICGACCADISQDAKKRKKKPQCPSCREPIQLAIILRVKFDDSSRK